MTSLPWVRCVTSKEIQGKAHNVATVTGHTLPEVYALWLSVGAGAMSVDATVKKLGTAKPKAAPKPKAKPKAAPKPKA